MVTPDTCAADTLKLWSFLPPFLQEQDATNSYLFLSWLDGIGQQQQIIDTLVRDDPPNPGWSIVLDITRCPTYALPWLGQFVGVRFSGTTIGNDQAMRNAILARGNFARGTTTAIISSALPYLEIIGGAVNVIERYPDPYSILIQISGDLNALTYADLAEQYPWYSNAGGTPSLSGTFATYDDFPQSNEAIVTASVLAAIPAGLVATVVFL